jgi:hypothetical protein
MLHHQAQQRLSVRELITMHRRPHLTDFLKSISSGLHPNRATMRYDSYLSPHQIQPTP